MALNPLDATVLGFSNDRYTPESDLLTLLENFKAERTLNSSNASLIGVLP